MGPDPYRNVVALTGFYGSGKSTAAKCFGTALGAHVVSADELAREAVKPGSRGAEQIRQVFGEHVFTPEGDLDRSELGAIVFSDQEKRRELEEVIHPVVAELAFGEFTRTLQGGSKRVIYDCPLFLEAGLYRFPFRSLVLVTAPREVCIERAMQRDGIPREIAEQRWNSQLPPKEKVRHADFILDNSGTPAQLEEKVIQLEPLLFPAEKAQQ